jgi:membrane protein required for colicin V production
MATTFNVLDLIFFSLAIIFAATAFFRGFVKEMFALITWILSFVISYFISPPISGLLASYFDNKLVLDIAVQSVSFILIFIGLTFAFSGLCDEMKNKISKSLDRSFGVLYGLFKTLIIFGFIYALATNILSVASSKILSAKDKSSQMPAWFRDAKTHNLIKSAGEALDFPVGKFLTVFVKVLDKKDGLNDKIDAMGLNKKIDEINHTEATIDELDQKLKDDGYNGYNKKDLDKLNHLIDIVK